MKAHDEIDFQCVDISWTGFADDRLGVGHADSPGGWWIGFDFGSSIDLKPGVIKLMRMTLDYYTVNCGGKNEVYRGFDVAKRVTERLASEVLGVEYVPTTEGSVPSGPAPAGA